MQTTAKSSIHSWPKHHMTGCSQAHGKIEHSGSNNAASGTGCNSNSTKLGAISAERTALGGILFCNVTSCYWAVCHDSSTMVKSPPVSLSLLSQPKKWVHLTPSFPPPTVSHCCRICSCLWDCWPQAIHMIANKIKSHIYGVLEYF